MPVDLNSLVNQSGYAPTNLYAYSFFDHIELYWSPPTNTVSGYQVYRSYTYDEQLVPLATTTGLNYFDSGVELYRQYYYRVTSLY